MYSSVKDMYNVNKSEEIFNKVQNETQNINMILKEFHNNILTMLKVEGNNEVSCRLNDNQFTIYLMSLDSIWSKTQVIMQLQRYGKSKRKANLIVAFDLSDDLINFIDQFEFVQYRKEKEMCYISFFKLYHSLKNNHVQKIILRLFEEYGDNRVKLKNCTFTFKDFYSTFIGIDSNSHHWSPHYHSFSRYGVSLLLKKEKQALLKVLKKPVLEVSTKDVRNYSFYQISNFLRQAYLNNSSKTANQKELLDLNSMNLYFNHKLSKWEEENNKKSQLKTLIEKKHKTQK